MPLWRLMSTCACGRNITKSARWAEVGVRRGQGLKWPSDNTHDGAVTLDTFIIIGCFRWSVVNSDKKQQKSRCLEEWQTAVWRCSWQNSAAYCSNWITANSNNQWLGGMWFVWSHFNHERPQLCPDHSQIITYSAAEWPRHFTTHPQLMFRLLQRIQVCTVFVLKLF